MQKHLFSNWALPSLPASLVSRTSAVWSRIARSLTYTYKSHKLVLPVSNTNLKAFMGVHRRASITLWPEVYIINVSYTLVLPYFCRKILAPHNIFFLWCSAKKIWWENRLTRYSSIFKVWEFMLCHFKFPNITKV